MSGVPQLLRGQRLDASKTGLGIFKKPKEFFASAPKKIKESGFINWLFCILNEGRWRAPIFQMIVNIVLFLIFMGIYAGHFKSTTYLKDGKLMNDDWGFPEGSITTNTIDGAYFAAVTATTVGFGDIVPKSTVAMFLVWLQITLFFIVNLIWSLECGDINV